MTTESKTAAKVFSFLNDEIRAGRGDMVLPGTEGLSGVLKRYPEGGENQMHCHHDQDHTFYVLQGQATFHLEKDENVVVVNEGDAVLLPRMTYYRFQSSGDVKLIMIRVSNSENNHGRLDTEGRPIPSTSDFRAQGGADRRTHAPVRDLPF
jgi:mannose-6-phosphate isomerase-like protein (cupin superfamily)